MDWVLHALELKIRTLVSPSTPAVRQAARQRRRTAMCTNAIAAPFVPRSEVRVKYGDE